MPDNIPRIGRLPRPDATASAYSKLCGSTITVDLKLRDGKVADYAHELKACALGQASASIMARNVVGSTPQELREARDALRRMLKENGPPPTGKWADLAVLEPVRDYKARHGSTMLAFDAVADARGEGGGLIASRRGLTSSHSVANRSIAVFRQDKGRPS